MENPCLGMCRRVNLLGAMALSLSSVLLGQSDSSVGSIVDLSPIRVIAPERDLVGILGISEYTTGAVDLYQIQTVQETTALAPNFYVSSSDSRGFGDVISMRGIANTIFFSPAGVSLYVDDVPSGDVFTYSPELNAGNSLTLHQGGRGSYFGRNGPGGVIEIQSRRPSEETESSVSLELASDDKRALRFNTSGTLVDSALSHNLSLYHSERDGFIYNALLDKKTDTREARGGEWSLFWSLGNDWDARVKVSMETIEDGSQRLSSLFSPNRFEVASDLEGMTHIDRSQGSIHLQRAFDWGLFKSITSIQNWEIDPSTVDLDLSPNPISTSTVIQDQDLKTQEFRFESLDRTAALQWRTGVFFMDKETKGDATRVFPAPPYFPVFTEQTLSTIEEKEIAAYGHISYRTSESFTVDGGIRIQKTDATIDRVKTSPVGMVPVVDSVDKSYFSPDVGFRLDLSDTVSLVGRSAFNFKPHGFSPYTDNPSIAGFEDESAWSNEVGIVLRSNDDSLNLRLTAYDIAIDDYQLERSVPQSTDYIVLNADEVSSQGLEAEVVWRASPRFQLEAGIGISDVVFDSHTDPFDSSSFNGLNVPFAPEYTVRGSAQYLFENGVFMQASSRLIGATHYDEWNSAMFRQGSYHIVDAQFGYRNEDFTIAFYGKNLGDEEYYNFINPQVFAGTSGDPRVFGLRFDWRF